MPNLGDFLGHLVSEITIARMQADVEAVRIAELYASHPLLSNLPVPHFRLPNIDIDVPVVIKSMEEPDPEKPGRGIPTIKEMHEKFKEVITKFLKDESLDLKPDARKKLDDSIEKEVTRLSQVKDTASNISRVADSFARISTSFLSPGVPPIRPRKENIHNSIRNLLRFEFLKLSKAPPRLEVLVRTTEIKEAGPNDIITRLHLKISEDGFEWSSSETPEGERIDKLIPE